MRGLVPAVGGVVLLAGAALLPTVVVPSLERVPDDPDTTTVLRAEEARVLDLTSATTLTTGLTLTSTTTAYEAGDPPPDGIAWWRTNTRIVDDGGVLRSESWEVQPFDARTGAASDCCEGFRVTAEGRTEEVRRAGLVLKFPFRTEPEDQQVWDPALGEAVTATYEGEDEIDGVRAYVFRTEVPATQVASTDVPAAALGIDSVRTVTAAQVYEGGRTVWVEPNTGGFLDLRQTVRQTLTAEGREVVAMEATFALSPDSRADAVDQLRRGPMLGRLRGVVPLGLGVLGLALLALALWRRSPSRR